MGFLTSEYMSGESEAWASDTIESVAWGRMPNTWLKNKVQGRKTNRLTDDWISYPCWCCFIDGKQLHVFDLRLESTSTISPGYCTWRINHFPKVRISAYLIHEAPNISVKKNNYIWHIMLVGRELYQHMLLKGLFTFHIGRSNSATVQWSYVKCPKLKREYICFVHESNNHTCFKCIKTITTVQKEPCEPIYKSSWCSNWLIFRAHLSVGTPTSAKIENLLNRVLLKACLAVAIPR